MWTWFTYGESSRCEWSCEFSNVCVYILLRVYVLGEMIFLLWVSTVAGRLQEDVNKKDTFLGYVTGSPDVGQASVLAKSRGSRPFFLRRSWLCWPLGWLSSWACSIWPCLAREQVLLLKAREAPREPFLVSPRSKLSQMEPTSGKRWK